MVVFVFSKTIELRLGQGRHLLGWVKELCGYPTDMDGQSDVELERGREREIGGVRRKERMRQID